MSYTEKQLVETYSGLFEGLSSLSKIELIEKLLKSLKKKEKGKDDEFYKSFGAFTFSKSPEKIIKAIRAGRKFSKKEIKF